MTGLVIANIAFFIIFIAIIAISFWSHAGLIDLSDGMHFLLGFLMTASFMVLIMTMTAIFLDGKG